MEYDRLEYGFPKLTGSAVTMGKFDGIHKGHKKLIDKILERKVHGERAVVIAFVSGKPMLFTSEERRRYLESLGIDVLLECPLSEAFLKMQAEAFVRNVLHESLDARYLAVGSDFRFGCGRKGTPELLVSMGEFLGFYTEILSKERYGDREISSTYIREELSKGNMEVVAEMLGRPFSLEGVVEHGRGMGHRHFFPTANVRPSEEKLMPPNGVYATRSVFSEKIYAGFTNVGYKPTVGERFLGVESYFYDCEEDLYGEACRIEFMQYQRPEMKFASYEALRAQIGQDIEAGRKYFEDLDTRR